MSGTRQKTSERQRHLPLAFAKESRSESPRVSEEGIAPLTADSKSKARQVKFDQLTRRGTNPYARWRWRRGAARLLPIPDWLIDSPGDSQMLGWQMPPGDSRQKPTYKPHKLLFRVVRLLNCREKRISPGFSWSSLSMRALTTRLR